MIRRISRWGQALFKILVYALVIYSGWYLAQIIDNLFYESSDIQEPAGLSAYTFQAERQPNFGKTPTVVGGSGDGISPALVVRTRATSYAIPKMLEACRVPFKTVTVQDLQQLQLELHGTGRFSVVIFASIQSYRGLDRAVLQTLHRYCLKHSVGILALVKPSAVDSSQILHLPVRIGRKQGLSHLAISPTAGDVLHITKADRQYTGSSTPSDWAVFWTNHTSYRSVLQAKPSLASPDVPHTTMILDQGLFDGIQRIFIGNGLVFWLNRVLFLDSISYLSRGLLRKSLDRYIQVDIDDIFQARKGQRMNPLDVEELLAKQQVLARKIPGFTFKLGFSGAAFRRGTADEKMGDELLVRNAHRFAWFPHMWAHAKAHTYDNRTKLVADMRKNFLFAQTHNISVHESYVVAPFHSGVYPAQAMLYDAWKEIWGLKVTSTEEYPAYQPARKRRGFIFKDIMVLPRQTCGLFTGIVVMDDYPGGKKKLDASIYGGELFHTIVSNPINVYMTHSGNFGNARLALYTFNNLVNFVQRGTNLRLRAVPPLELGKKYFDLFPEERDPLWTNPCSDQRHVDILPKTQDCTKLPNLLVIGPQKTGSTALYEFLRLHPNIRSNRKSLKTYEEIQFFCSSNYLKGLDWYIDFFPRNSTGFTEILFEKSATYFDSSVAPKRAHRLLPKAKVISILIDPAKRAYSWYQHERAHGNPASLNYTFYEVLTSDPDAPRQVTSLRSRCLNPGKYVQHLQKWLQYYSSSQLLVVDGDELRTDPAKTMLRIQQFVQVKQVIDFRKKLVYSPQKGYYCVRYKGGRPRCLGSNKGSPYPPMAHQSAKYLGDFYQDFNTQLAAILESSGQTLPVWLRRGTSQ